MSTKNADSSSRPGFEWLYPGLLSKDQLVKALEQRYIRGSDLQELDKDDLVDLYNQYIIPLPQRKYRHNRRGRDMTVKQVKMAKKRRAVAPPDYSLQPPEKRKSTGKLMTSSDTPPTVGDRLKPPPSCIDTTKKKIKLGLSSSSSSSSLSSSPSVTVASSLNKLKLTKSESSESSSPVTSTEAPKKIRLKHSIKASSGDNSDVTKATVVSAADRDGTGDKATKESVEKVVEKKDQEPMDTSETAAEEEAVVKKKKIKISRISWP